MINNVVIELNKEKQLFFVMLNGGIADSFDAEIFQVGQVISYAKKKFITNAMDNEIYKISFGTSIELPKCKKCGSNNVEIKAFVNQRTGKIDYSSYEDVDTYCNDCEDHTGVE